MAPAAPRDAEPASAKNADATVMVADQHIPRSATWLDVAYHSVTAMIGAGVLGLPAVFAHLGWAGGIIMLVFSLWVSWYTYKLLVYMHEVPDLDNAAGGGIRRLDRYDQLADYVLGKGKGKLVLLPFQLAVLIGIAVTYTVVGGESLSAFAKGVSPSGSAGMPLWAFFILFGALQMVLSMLPNFNDLRLVSLLGALMSCAYCLIAIVMSSATVRPGPDVSYDPASVARTPIQRVMGIFNALTTVLFAYGGHNVALEIQATIPVGGKHGLSSVPPMMKGVLWTFVLTGIAYFGVAITGFYAFGVGVGDNVLLAFAAGRYHAVVVAADMFVVVHVAAAYQVYTQPVFSLIEARIKKATGRERLPLVMLGALRIVYVAAITLLGIVIPFFGALMGLIGAIAITPTTFTLPPLLWIMYKKPRMFGWEWSLNAFLVAVTGLMGVLGTVGAVYSIISAWSTYKVFAS